MSNNNVDELLDKMLDVLIAENLTSGRAGTYKEETKAKLNTLIEQRVKENDSYEDFVFVIGFLKWESSKGQSVSLSVKPRGKLHSGDLYLHGLSLADNDLLDDEQRFAIKEFCRAYIKQFQAQQEKDNDDDLL